MRVFESIDAFSPDGPTVVTLGTFDGVHLGHRKILERLIQLGRKKKSESVLLTFSPHPRQVLQPRQNDLKLLNTLSEKAELLDQLGLDNLIIHPFTREFSRLSYLAFVREILVGKMKLKTIVIGHNHQFGRNREGSFEQLKELAAMYDFEVEEIPPEELDQVAISSTKIRKALQEGDLAKANAFLGYPYMLSGKVVAGNGVGRSLGFPTANIRISDPDKLVPADGVYSVKVMVGENTYQGMLNIGFRPTVKGKNRTVEVHILDFDRPIYDIDVVLQLYARIRDEKKFDTMEDLAHQLEIDKNKTLRLFEN